MDVQRRFRHLQHVLYASLSTLALYMLIGAPGQVRLSAAWELFAALLAALIGTAGLKRIQRLTA